MGVYVRVLSALSLVLAVVAAVIDSIPPDPPYDVIFDQLSAQLGSQTSISYTATAYGSESIDGLSLILLQTTAEDGLPIDASNTQKLVEVQPGESTILFASSINARYGG